jgi:hypothetical protein
LLKPIFLGNHAPIDWDAERRASQALSYLEEQTQMSEEQRCLAIQTIGDFESQLSGGRAQSLSGISDANAGYEPIHVPGQHTYRAFCNKVMEFY